MREHEQVELVPESATTATERSKQWRRRGGKETKGGGGEGEYNTASTHRKAAANSLHGGEKTGEREREREEAGQGRRKSRSCTQDSKIEQYWFLNRSKTVFSIVIRFSFYENGSILKTESILLKTIKIRSVLSILKSHAAP
jgi:hypothetical protein